jgi:hypothetical protein
MTSTVIGFASETPEICYRAFPNCCSLRRVARSRSCDGTGASERYVVPRLFSPTTNNCALCRTKSALSMSLWGTIALSEVDQMGALRTKDVHSQV